MTSLPWIRQTGGSKLTPFYNHGDVGLEEVANFTNKIVVDFDNRTLILPISLFYQHQIHQFEHYLSFSAITRRPGRLCRQDLRSSCIKHNVCKTDFHSCFSPPKLTHCVCKRRTISVVFQQAHFSSAGTLVRREFPLLSGKRSQH